MASVLLQLLELLSKNIDSAMVLLDQAKILQAMDALITLTDFVHQESVKADCGHLPKSAEDSIKEPQKKVFQKDRTKKSLTNVLRRLILRV